MGDSGMTKEAVIQSFFESYGLPAFPATSVPTSGNELPQFPYITYTAPTDSDLGRFTVTCSVYDRSEGWTGVNAIVRTISQDIMTGKVLECDGGAIIVRKGSPFAQPVGDDSDNMIKRKVLMFDFMFATTY